jgi:hypothetical protein
MEILEEWRAVISCGKGKRDSSRFYSRLGPSIANVELCDKL